VTSRARDAWAIVALNLGLALLVHVAAPVAPRNSDRTAYEYVGQHGLDANCPVSIYCYRVLVPMVLARIPLEPERRWRWYQVAATAAAGSITAATTSRLAGGLGAGVIASLLVQTTYGFSFTAYDPYTADPLVFVFAAALAWCAIADRWLLALGIGLAGVFVKETVALVSVSCALAALGRDRPTWPQWVFSSAAVVATLLGFHWIMDTYFDWGLRNNPAAQFGSGSWLALWWRNNPFLIRKAYLLFAPFGFAWLFALLAGRFAEARLRQLALGAIGPFLALCYVQTPERALSNAFFVVIPLATLYLVRAPLPIALLTALANGAVTVKVGLSTTWLPPSRYLMVPALILTLGAIWTIEKPRTVTPPRRLTPQRVRGPSPAAPGDRP
jgi:hypothetical protein